MPAASAPSGETPAIEDPAAKPARILVLDDEEELGNLLAEMLRTEGHAVEATADPHAALARLRDEGVDLLFTDLGMPDLAGWDVADRARAIRPDVPVILITGWGHQIEAQEVRAHGVAGVVPKPYKMEDLTRAVAAALNGRGMAIEAAGRTESPPEEMRQWNCE